MRRSALIAVLLLACAASAQSRRSTHAQAQAAAQQLQDDQTAINKLHDREIQGWMALDAPAVENLWTDDVVEIPPGHDPVVGKEANAKRLESQFDALKSQEILAYNEQWQEVRIEGDWAYEYGVVTGRTRPFAGGAETDYKINVLRVLNRQPDQSWKISRSIWNNALPAEPKKEEPKQEEKQQNKLEN